MIFTNIVTFNGTNGGEPGAALVPGSDGYLYGTTSEGGAYRLGTVFRMDTNGTLTTLYSFGQNLDAEEYSLDGANPFCTLAEGSDGYFYGTTLWAGTNHNGTVFKINPAGALSTLYSFNVSDGSGLDTGVTQGSDGDFYGVANQGGTNGYGTLFKISSGGVFTVLHRFTDLADGGNPDTDGLVLGSDGNLYGMTLLGGTGGQGTVYQVPASGVLNTLYSFPSDDSMGTIPKSGLIQGSDGNFYGTTSSGGIGGEQGMGTVFRITTNGALTTLASFVGIYGAGPTTSPLVQGRDGSFYGAAPQRGANGFGAIFKVTCGGVLTTLYSFTISEYVSPGLGGLVQAGDGNFYGTTQNYGDFQSGTVYRLTVLPPPAPVFQSITQTNGMLTLTWSTEAGATYQVEYNGDLNGTNWTDLGSAATATTNTLSGTDSVANSAQRFYRIALLP